jgi:hypothetical protein
MAASGSVLTCIPRAAGLLIFHALLLLLAVTQARATESRSYAVSWFAPATNSQDGDCPEGINPPWAQQELKDLADLGYSPQQIALLARKDAERNRREDYDGVIDVIMAHRGRLNGHAVDPMTYPATVVDPQLHYLKGKYAYGFNLDGKGAASPNSFEDPETHELGVNNQLYRALGCLRVFRGTLESPPVYYFYIFGQIKDSQPVWLITLSGDDLSHDGDVDITFDRALEHMRYNTDGTPRPDETYRIDSDPRSHHVFHGRLKDGVITLANPGSDSIYMLENQLYINEFRMSKVHIRLRMKADGTLDCMMGGYQPWADWYWAITASGSESTEAQGIDQDAVGMYYLLKKLADGGPDPKTGLNALISATYNIKAVPAFAVAAGASQAVRAGAAVSAVRLQPSLHDVIAFTPAEIRSHRLSSSQYRNTIADVFGPDIELGGRFEPGVRIDGLLQAGLGNVSVTAAGMEQYDAMARKIASQVVDERHRAMLIPCQPRSAAAPDDACARRAMGKFGLLLYRRPLTASELNSYVGAARSATGMTKDFYSGLSLSLAAMLSSPKFLFRPEVAVPDRAHPSGYRLDDYSLAARLSTFLWDAEPDVPLLAAAERGELSTRSGYQRQVERMLASPRLEQGVRSFFRDLFQFDEFATLSKDATLYPKFNVQVAADAQEETLRTVVDLLLVRHGDYRDVFTTKRTFLTPELAAIYRVPFASEVPNGSPDAWGAYEYPASDAREGILSQVSFTALHSPPGRASATIRGKALREIMLCEKVPSPPANVNFKIVLDTSNPVYKTARERLTAHRSNPVCAGCHKFVDPIGLSLENFDGIGAYRTRENDVLIDTSGELGGNKFDGPAGLGRAIRDDPAAVSCLVNRLESYALGRQLSKEDLLVVQQLQQSFAMSGYRLPQLMRQIVTDESFFRVSPPQALGPDQASLIAPSKQAVAAGSHSGAFQ